LYLTVKSQKTHENYKIKHVSNQTVSSSEESLADQNSNRRQHSTSLCSQKNGTLFTHVARRQP